MAASLGIPARRVSKAINKGLSQNFSTALQTFRIREACRRLSPRSEAALIILSRAVAESVGFRSRSNFHSIFKKITGLTPSQYLAETGPERECLTASGRWVTANKCGGLCVEELMKLNDILLTLCVMVMTLFGGVSCVRDGNAATSSVTHSEQDSISMNMKEIFLCRRVLLGYRTFLFQSVWRDADRSRLCRQSRVPDPSYRQVCTGKTGAAETVKVTYDPDSVSLPFLIDLYLKTVDPTSVNRQGNDTGTQYRTGIYYTDLSDRDIISGRIDRLERELGRRVAIEVKELENFYPAEDYHQKYLYKNPGGYCHINPSLFREAAEARDPSVRASRKVYARPSDAELRRRLTPEQYAVTQHAATERPFSNEYDHEFRGGIYVDITTGQPLFCLYRQIRLRLRMACLQRKPISQDAVTEHADNSHGMRRIEVRSKDGDAHLGHVFSDGPRESGGMRYCINSASLRFIPEEDMSGKATPNTSRCSVAVRTE